MLMNNRSIQIVRVMDLGVRFLIFFLWANVGTTYLKTCTVNISIFFFTKYETWYLIFKTFSLFCNISRCGNIFTCIFAPDVECLAHFRCRCLHSVRGGVFARLHVLSIKVSVVCEWEYFPRLPCLNTWSAAGDCLSMHSRCVLEGVPLGRVLRMERLQLSSLLSASVLLFTVGALRVPFQPPCLPFASLLWFWTLTL